MKATTRRPATARAYFYPRLDSFRNFLLTEEARILSEQISALSLVA
jgi:hypothetical protein